MPTDAEYLDAVERLLADGRKDDARFLMERYQARKARAVRPMAPQVEPPVEFADPMQVAAAQREAVATEAREAVAAKGVFLPAGVGVTQATEQEAKRIAAEKEREAQKVAIAGQDEPMSTTSGIFRPTRIREVDVVEPVQPQPYGYGVLLEPFVSPEVPEGPYAAFQAPAPVDTATTPTVRRRMYLDPTTGQYRPPTMAEEVREAFALQTERGETERREAEARIATEQADIERRLSTGEGLSEWEKIAGPLMSGVLTEGAPGAGIVETPLGATLRAALSWGSAAAAEGVFRGLGYEVDEAGNPVDPEDFGYMLAELRRAAGLPEVIAPSSIAVELAQTVGERLGIDPEAVSTVTNALEAVPQLAVPLPGIATESQQRKVTTFDPEGRRRVETVDVPSPVEDFAGFLRAEGTRIAQNVAKGRTFGDEFLDTPAARDYYARVWGDEDAAYIAGMLPEVVIPGPEVLLSAPGWLAGTAADLARLSSKSKAIAAQKSAARAVQSARRAESVAWVSGDAAGLIRASQATAAAQRRLAELVDAGTDYDPGLLQAVTTRAIRGIVRDPTEQARALGALAQAKPQTFGEVSRALPGIVGEDAARVANMVYRNLPGDYVMLTDAIAVPRASANEARAALREHRAATFTRSSRDIINAAYDIAPTLPEGAARQRLLRAVMDASDELSRSTGRAIGWEGIAPEPRKVIESFVKQWDQNPDALTLFAQKGPGDLLRGVDIPLSEQLAQYRTWRDVPANLRRAAVDANDMRFPGTFAPRARRAKDLTRAQTWFRTAEQNVFKQVLGSKLFDSPAGRRLLARYAPLETETRLAARVADEITQSAKTALSTTQAKLVASVQRLGSVDAALDDLMRAEVGNPSFDPRAGEVAPAEGPQQAWEALWGHLYGDQYKDQVVQAVRQDGLLRASPEGEILDYPTVQAAKAIDTLLASGPEAVLSGGSVLSPDIQAGMLKVIVENGLRRQAARRAVTGGTLELAAASDAYTPEVLRAMTSGLDAEEAARAYLKFPDLGEVAKTPPGQTIGSRLAVWDKGASFAEKMVAEGGEGLFAMLDSIPVQARADFVRMAEDAYKHTITAGQRNWQSRVKYGYVVPNLPVQLGRLAQQAVIPLVMIGARDTLRAVDRAGQRAVGAVFRRRMQGGGITDASGLYYPPEVLESLASDVGLGVSRVDVERVGSLAQDLFRTAKRAAKTNGTPVPSWANPLDRGAFLRFAEAMEINFRRAVFETSIARGDPPTEAARLARDSQLDLSQVPDAVAQWAGRYVNGAASTYRLAVEAIGQAVQNPRAAMSALRALRAKAEVQDPEALHGDRALKSLGIVTVDDDKFYLPDTGMLAPIDGVLASLRAADSAVADVRYLAQAAGIEDIGDAPRVGGEVLLPAVLDAWERYSEGQAYPSQGVPEAAEMSDTKAFWGAMIAAHAMDPTHSSAWPAFVAIADPVMIPPPKGAEGSTPNTWNRQPPEGTPHILWDVIDGEPLYYVAKPSDRGARNIQVARKLDPFDIERALPFAGLLDQTKGTRPMRVYGGPDQPETLGQAVGAALLPPAKEPTERQLAERVRAASETGVE